MAYLRILLFGFLLAGSGCKSELEKYESYVEELCRCKDAACARKVRKKIDEKIDLYQVATDNFEESTTLSAKRLQCTIAMMPKREKTKSDLLMESLQGVVAEICACTDHSCVEAIEAKRSATLGPETIATLQEDSPYTTEVILDHLEKCRQALAAPID